jgi:hypothetical protein
MVRAVSTTAPATARRSRPPTRPIVGAIDVMSVSSRARVGSPAVRTGDANGSIGEHPARSSSARTSTVAMNTWTAAA